VEARFLFTQEPAGNTRDRLGVGESRGVGWGVVILELGLSLLRESKQSIEKRRVRVAIQE